MRDENATKLHEYELPLLKHMRGGIDFASAFFPMREQRLMMSDESLQNFSHRLFMMAFWRTISPRFFMRRFSHFMRWDFTDTTPRLSYDSPLRDRVAKSLSRQTAAKVIWTELALVSALLPRLTKSMLSL